MRPNLYYPITNPNTGETIYPKKTRVWAYSKEVHHEHLRNDLIYWGKNGLGKVPSFKRYRHLLKGSVGTVPNTWWDFEFAGHTDESKKEIRSLDFDIGVFDFITPTPTRLIQRILQIASDGPSLILDSFAGSGTTAHAVLKQNAADGGERKFILVEMEPNIARDITAERVRRVIECYTDSKGKAVEGLGGGFQYCRLSKQPLFDAFGAIRDEVSFEQLAEFVWFAETGTGGNLVGDAQIAAVALRLRGTVHSADFDFACFLELPWHYPLDGPK